MMEILKRVKMVWEEQMTKQKLELRFCDLRCEYAKPSDNTPGCMTENPIYCTKYNLEVRKSSVCLDNRR